MQSWDKEQPAVSGDSGQPIMTTNKSPRKINSLTVQRLLLMGLGLALLVAGIMRDDVLQMWRRATQLCLGCIGIG